MLRAYVQAEIPYESGNKVKNYQLTTAYKGYDIWERNLNWQWDYLHVISSTKHQSVEDMKFNFEILKLMTSAKGRFIIPRVEGGDILRKSL